MKIRVAIFEDNKSFRKSLAMLIDGEPGLELAGVFEDANNAVKDIQDSGADVVLMDIEMPGSSGIEALRAIKTRLPDVSILMQTVFEDEGKIYESICNGASGYMLKNSLPSRMLEAIKETYYGGAPMTPLIARKVFDLLQATHQPTHPEPQENTLTPREKEILALMVQGMSYKMMAAHCHISFETARTHIRNIYGKLHVATMTEAVAKAIRSGMA